MLTTASRGGTHAGHHHIDDEPRRRHVPCGRFVSCVEDPLLRYRFRSRRRRRERRPGDPQAGRDCRGCPDRWGVVRRVSVVDARRARRAPPRDLGPGRDTRHLRDLRPREQAALPHHHRGRDDPGSGMVGRLGPRRGAFASRCVPRPQRQPPARGARRLLRSGSRRRQTRRLSGRRRYLGPAARRGAGGGRLAGQAESQ